MRQNYKKDENNAPLTRRETIARIWKYCSIYRKEIVFISLLALITSISKTLIPLLTEKAIDEDIKSGDVRGLVLTISTAVVLAFIWLIASVVRDRLTNRIANDCVYRVRTETYHNILSLPLAFFDTRPSGRIITRVINDSDKLKEITKSLTSTLVPSFVFLISIMVVMVIMNPFLALSAFVVIPFMVIFTYLVVIRGYHNWETFRKKESNFSSFIHEDYSGIRAIQSFQAEKETEKECKRLLEESKNAWIKAVRRSDAFGIIISASQALGYVMLFLCAVCWMKKGESSIGEILAFITYIGYFWQPIRQIASTYNTLINNLSAAARVFEMMDEKSDIIEADDKIDLKVEKGEVEFRNVTFSYPDDSGVDIIENLSFHVDGGQSIALVGPTGAGKTTIINLLARFYDPVDGVVLIDGIDIKKISFKSLRAFLSVMPQDSMLFSGTIRENLLYGKETSDEEMKRRVEELGLTAMIEALPSGYDTLIKDASLSSGQKQLIALARTLIASPSILILDEATSNVDTITEKMVQNGLKVLMKGRTSFIVAHRLSTIQNADLIFVVGEKTILEMGNHESLMKKKDGIYRKLYLSQFEGIRKEDE